MEYVALALAAVAIVIAVVQKKEMNEKVKQIEASESELNDMKKSVADVEKSFNELKEAVNNHEKYIDDISKELVYMEDFERKLQDADKKLEEEINLVSEQKHKAK